jgi:hypothetical protein
LPLFPESSTIVIADFPDVVYVALHSIGERAELGSKSPGGTFTRCDGKGLTPFLQRWDARIFKVGEAGGISVAFYLL